MFITHQRELVCLFHHHWYETPLLGFFLQLWETYQDPSTNSTKGIQHPYRSCQVPGRGLPLSRKYDLKFTITKYTFVKLEIKQVKTIIPYCVDSYISAICSKLKGYMHMDKHFQTIFKNLQYRSPKIKILFVCMSYMMRTFNIKNGNN